ncbi:carbohydrate-binding protein [Paenibacillus sp. LHD-117]|uniref:carbohydrate-binding protein n=1 Tax=Paenibacillus sp. LHD-117 TaxID=3071412 RepID=UPI0027DF2942|nr:carbohydrate-binding protein [Paenibacillus sp. LHD-117]MDQ6419025.1 carbohydrate-binding protein [Paenibacillus sp. LHD-117]
MSGWMGGREETCSNDIREEIRIVNKIRLLAGIVMVALLGTQLYASPEVAHAASAFVQTAASSYSSQSGIQLEPSSEGGQNVAFIDNGDHIAFTNVDFGSGATSVKLRVASNTTGGKIEIRTGSANGTLAGTCVVPPTGGWQSWITKTCAISTISGVHTLYLKFTGGVGNLFNVHWYQFSNDPAGGDVFGKIIAGYQGWFTAVGDSSPLNNWTHWSKNGSAPAPTGNVNFEMYPDMSEYSQSYQTGLGNLGNGQPAKLFSSYDQSTVSKHFEWMKTYGIYARRFSGSARMRTTRRTIGSRTGTAWRSKRKTRRKRTTASFTSCMILRGWIRPTGYRRSRPTSRTRCWEPWRCPRRSRTRNRTASRSSAFGASALMIVPERRRRRRI